MSLSIFEDKLKKPEQKEITEVLGSTEHLWNNIIDYIVPNYTGALEEWKYYGKSSGWMLLIKHKKRTILYLIPHNGFFIVLFVFGEKAARDACESNLPHYIIEKIESAKPYVEGRSFQIEVRNEQDIEYIKMLIDIKMINT